MKGATEIGYRFRLISPSLCFDQMTHIGPGLEGMCKCGKGQWRIVPAQLFHFFVQPELKCLRTDGLHMVNHVTPSVILFDKVGRHIGNCAETYTKNNAVE